MEKEGVGGWKAMNGKGEGKELGAEESERKRWGEGEGMLSRKIERSEERRWSEEEKGKYGGRR